jgi:hypothetical protein
MPFHHIFNDGKETLMSALGTFDFWLLAYSADPFVSAYRRITGFACFPVFKASGIDIFPATKKRAEEGDFVVRR